MKKLKILLIFIVILLTGCKEKKEEKNVLKIHMHFRNKYAYNDKSSVSQKAEKLTGQKLKSVLTNSATNSLDLFEIMILSKKYPDIVAGDRLASSFKKYGNRGIFIPLNSLIENYAPNIKKYFLEHPEILDSIKDSKGDIYYIPYIPDGKTGAGYWIREDWLKKLNISIPDNVDEFYSVMKKFKNNDLNENGKKDEIPIFFRRWQDLYSLVTLFGARSSGSSGEIAQFYENNGIVKQGWIEPEFKNAIKNIAKWYNEGLIDPEVFTRGEFSREELLGKNVGGMTHDWFASTGQFNEILKNKIKDFKLISFAPPKNIYGKRIEESSRTLVKPDGWAITSTSSKKIEAIKYFDFFFSKEGRILANYGVENIHYTLVDGKPIFKKELLQSNKPINQILVEEGAQIPIGFVQDYNYEKQWTNPIAQKGVDEYINNGYILDEYILPNLTSEEQEIYNRLWPNMVFYMTETTKNWIIENKNIDEEWDLYINNLNKMGMSKLLEILQNANERRKKELNINKL